MIDWEMSGSRLSGSRINTAGQDLPVVVAVVIKGPLLSSHLRSHLYFPVENTDAQMHNCIIN